MEHTGYHTVAYSGTCTSEEQLPEGQVSRQSGLEVSVPEWADTVRSAICLPRVYAPERALERLDETELKRNTGTDADEWQSRTCTPGMRLLRASCPPQPRTFIER